MVLVTTSRAFWHFLTMMSRECSRSTWLPAPHYTCMYRWLSTTPSPSNNYYPRLIAGTNSPTPKRLLQTTRTIKIGRVSSRTTAYTDYRRLPHTAQATTDYLRLLHITEVYRSRKRTIADYWLLPQMAQTTAHSYRLPLTTADYRRLLQTAKANRSGPRTVADYIILAQLPHTTTEYRRQSQITA